MRLDRFLANNTAYSRTEIKKLIKQERVEIPGLHDIHASSEIDPANTTIYLDGQSIKAADQLYIVLHKPAGFVSATQDAVHPTLIDLIKNRNAFLGTDEQWRSIQSKTLQIVGRLDLDTTGMIFLTNDGDWNHRMTSPNASKTKSYIVDLDNDITKAMIDAIEGGIVLKNEAQSTRPARLVVQTARRVTLTLTEGKYHQVKRMFAACGNHVVGLHRSQIHTLALDEKLEAGQFRLLTAEELSLLDDTRVNDDV